jgi:hypothetical protein
VGVFCCASIVVLAAVAGSPRAADAVLTTSRQPHAMVERQSPAARSDGLRWRGPFGAAAPDRLYAGLWTLHLRSAADGFSQHWLVGVGWRGTVAGTFINSHGDRSWMAGVAREMVTWERGTFGASAGYRLGVVHGYDERLHNVAGRWPAVPAGELVGTVRRGRVGLTVSYAGIVTSVGGFVSVKS